MLFDIVIVLLLLTLLDYLYKIRRTRILSDSGIKGPTILAPLIGDSWVGIGVDIKHIFRILKGLWNSYGITYRLWIFHRLLVISTEPKFMEAVLTSQKVIKKPFIYDMMRSWLADGLLLSNGRKWHNRRKILTPSYHFSILEQFVEVFDQQSRVLVQRLKAKADGQTAVDIFPIICLTALDIISETVMGVKINAQEHPEFPYAKAVTEATDIIGNRMVKPTQYYDIGFLLTAFPSYLRLRKNIKIMHAFTEKVISDRIKTLNAVAKNSKQTTQDENDVGQKKRMAFLDVLLQATIDGQPLEREQIREEVDTFMFEGHDTTTSAISHCLYDLARHPEIQQRVLEEVYEVLGKDGNEPVTMKQLHELKYMEACIRESLRLHPSVPIVARHTEEDMHYGDNKCIPANTTIIFPLLLATYNEDFFPRAMEFDPERQVDYELERQQMFLNVPFSAGPRNCIGQKFAMLEMKSILSMILRNFELLPLGPKVVATMNVILRSQTGIKLGLRPRQVK